MSNPQTKEKDKKVRVFELAKELALGSKDLVSMAKDLGFAGVTWFFYLRRSVGVERVPSLAQASV